MLKRRLQILVDEERYRRLAEAARSRSLSVGAAIREAIDVAFPGDPDERRVAARTILEAPPMPVPDPVELRGELEALHGRRA